MGPSSGQVSPYQNQISQIRLSAAALTNCDFGTAHCLRILYHDFAWLHHGSRTFAKCLLRSRLAHYVRVYYNTNLWKYIVILLILWRESNKLVYRIIISLDRNIFFSYADYSLQEKGTGTISGSYGKDRTNVHFLLYFFRG